MIKSIPHFHKQIIRFTGDKPCVNPCPRPRKCGEHGDPAGKNLGELSLINSQACPHPCLCREHGGDAMSLTPVFLPGQGAGLGVLLQGQLRRFNQTIASKVKILFKKYNLTQFFGFHTNPNKRKTVPYTRYLTMAGFLLGILLIPQELWAVTDGILKAEIEGVEKLFTGGYMRLGLLGVCGFAAIYGVIKQSGWMFVSGIMGCVFAYFMKGWIHTSFPMVI